MAEFINLQLFADGAASGDVGTPAGNTEGNRPGNDNSGANGDKQINPHNSLSHGQAVTAPSGREPMAEKGGDSSDAGNNKNTDKDRQAAYDAFIAENKDLHQAHIQNIINKRFKEGKQKDEIISAQNVILGIIGQKYGIKDGDIDALRKAVEEDNSYFEEAAEREGLTVDQYREVSRLRAEAERSRIAEEQRQAQTEVQKQMDEWFRQSAELKETYPEFDFRGEMQNISFRRLLQAGIPVKTAYETIHMSDIVSAARAETEKSVIENIRERQLRPKENGLRSSGGFVLDKDVSKLTKKERAELRERARRGETITL